MVPKRILLMVVASSKFWRILTSSSLSMPPLGLLSIAALLKMHGYEVRIVDLYMGVVRDDFERQVRDFDPHVVGVSCHTETYDSAIPVTRKVRQLVPGARIVMGGPHVTFTVDQTFTECAVDYIVLHEGEITMLNLLLHLEYPNIIPASKVLGLAWRDGERIVVNEPRPPMASLASLPLPDCSLLLLDAYLYQFAVVTSRGCPGDCIYCSARAMWGSRYRARPAAHVYSEVYVRAKQTARRFFSIPDDTFTADTKRVREFCELLLQSGLDLEWHCESRADVMTEDLLDLMRKAGCKAVQFGIETASPEVLSTLNKRTSLEKTERLVAHAHAIGMVPRCSFMLGHHTDTPETIRQTADMAKRFRKQYHASCSVSSSTPFPGTYLYLHRDELGIAIHASRWEEYIFSEPMVSGRNFTVDDIRDTLFDVVTFLAEKDIEEQGAAKAAARAAGAN